MEDALTLDTLAKSAADMAMSIDTIWVLVTAALVFFMQAGLPSLKQVLPVQKIR
jgi:hypothetical protein